MHQTTHKPMHRTRRPIATAVTVLGLTLGLAVATTAGAVADEFSHFQGTSGDDRLHGTAAADDMRESTKTGCGRTADRTYSAAAPVPTHCVGAQEWTGSMAVPVLTSSTQTPVRTTWTAAGGTTP